VASVAAQQPPCQVEMGRAEMGCQARSASTISNLVLRLSSSKVTVHTLSKSPRLERLNGLSIVRIVTARSLARGT